MGGLLEEDQILELIESMWNEYQSKQQREAPMRLSELVSQQIVKQKQAEADKKAAEEKERLSRIEDLKHGFNEVFTKCLSSDLLAALEEAGLTIKVNNSDSVTHASAYASLPFCQGEAVIHLIWAGCQRFSMFYVKEFHTGKNSNVICRDCVIDDEHVLNALATLTRQYGDKEQ